MGACIAQLCGGDDDEDHQRRGRSGQPQAMKCGNCGQVFGIPPGHMQVRCPKCGMVNAVPQPQEAKIPVQVHNQPTGLTPATSVGQPGPRPSGRKKSLLVGINYPGTRAELRGCINDVQRMSRLLKDMYGFPMSPDAQMMLTDDSLGRNAPTRSNILRGLQWLAQGAQPGDCLFFHYSGHGAQQEDPTYMEEDGYDETICPCDFESAGMIVDTEIFDIIVAPLPAGVKLVAVMDCCHSGTGLDLPFELKWGQWAEEDNPCHSQADAILISGCQDDQTSADGGGSYYKPMGAMTTALCNTLERSGGRLDYTQLLNELRQELRQGGFDQVPSLTSSQRFNPGKPFSMVDHIEGNSNPQLGRHFRKQKHPQRANLLQGGLGQMLMEGAVGFMMADMLMDGGQAVGGLLMGGGGDGDFMGGDRGMFNADGGGGGMFDDGGGDGGGFFGGLGDFFGGDDDGGDDDW